MVVLLAGLAVVLLSSPAQSQSRTLTVLYSFTGPPDGAYPYGGVTMDRQGNLYGTTSQGGTYGKGTIYKIDTLGRMSVLHEFSDLEGWDPLGALLLDNYGNLYGTTYFRYGAWGIVFELKPSGNFKVLHAFGHDQLYDGAYPGSGLILDRVGNLYGTTYGAGRWGWGAVFKVDSRTGIETVLYSFEIGIDGSHPTCKLLMDSEGNLYGTTDFGGTFGSGTVFRLDPSGVETVLYNFGEWPSPDGYQPTSELIKDAQGSLYGTTYKGGKFGYGTVFKLDPSGKQTVLHDFDGIAVNPYAGVVRDSAGNLYGTTQGAGGTVYRLSRNGSFTILARFRDASPYAGVILDHAGNLYGATFSGGKYGYGMVYKLTH